MLVTLIYLAVQVRQNTRSTRTQSWQAAVASVSDWSREVRMNPEIIQILQAGNSDFDALPDIEKVQFSLIMNSFLRNCEKIHYQFLNGTIDESVWLGWAERTVVSLHPPGARAWWQTSFTAYSPQFQKFIRHAKPTGSMPLSFFEPPPPAV